MPDYPLHFTQHPVTNGRYHRFIQYLAGDGDTIFAQLPRDQFTQDLLKRAETDKGFKEYLEQGRGYWALHLRSVLHDEKRFNGDDGVARPDTPTLTSGTLAAKRLETTS